MTYIKVYDGKYRKVMKDNKTGHTKELILDQEERESIRKGDHLQPYGKDEKRFFGINKQVKKMSNGEIVNIAEHRRQKKENEEQGVDMEKEEWKAEQEMRRLKGGNPKKYF